MTGDDLDVSAPDNRMSVTSPWSYVVAAAAAGKNTRENDRLKRRREQNRLAAQRSRERQKNLTTQYLKECQTLNSCNTELRRQIRELTEARQQLADLLDAHLAQHHPGCSAERPLSPSSSSYSSTVDVQTATTSTTIRVPVTTVDLHQQSDDLTQWYHAWA